MDPKLALAMMLNPSETIANINDEALMDIYGLAYVEIYGNDGQPVNCDELRTTHIAKMNEIPDHIFAVVSEFWLETLAIEDLPPTARAVAQTIVDKVSAHVKVCDHHADPGDFAKAGCDYLAETQADYRLQIANPEAWIQPLLVWWPTRMSGSTKKVGSRPGECGLGDRTPLREKRLTPLNLFSLGWQ